MTKCKPHRKLVVTFENVLQIFTINIIYKQVLIISSWKNIRRCNITRGVSVKSLLKSAVLWNVKRSKLFLYTPRRHMGSSGVMSLILNTEVSGQLHSPMALPSGKSPPVPTEQEAVYCLEPISSHS